MIDDLKAEVVDMVRDCDDYDVLDVVYKLLLSETA